MHSSVAAVVEETREDKRRGRKRGRGKKEEEGEKEEVGEKEVEILRANSTG